MKYTIELSVRGRGVQLLKLEEEEKEELLEEESLDSVYMDWLDKKDWDFALENTYITEGCDRFSLVVKDEDDNVVYETDDVNDLIDRDKTYNDVDETQVEGWDFYGVEDGCYLTRIQTLKGCGYTAELELDEEFDPEKMYIILDTEIDDELMGNVVYPLCDLYYQQGEGYDFERDEVCCDPDGMFEEQYWETYLMEVKSKNAWTDLRE